MLPSLSIVRAQAAFPQKQEVLDQLGTELIQQENPQVGFLVTPSCPSQTSRLLKFGPRYFPSCSQDQCGLCVPTLRRHHPLLNTHSPQRQILSQNPLESSSGWLPVMPAALALHPHFSLSPREPERSSPASPRVFKC